MEIRNIILGMLVFCPMTGYEIKQEFDTSLGLFSGASFGSIYPVLKRLKDEKLVTMKVQHQDGRPSRKVYTITEGGKRAFGKALGDNLDVPPYRNEFMTRAFFFGALPPKMRESLTRQYLDHLASKVQAVKEIEPHARKEADPYQMMVLRMGQRLIGAYKKATEQFLSELLEEDAS